MKTIKTLEFDNLINGHYQELKKLVLLLNFIKENEKIKIDLNIEDTFSYVEKNIEFHCFLVSSFLDLLSSLKGIRSSSTDWELGYYSRIVNLTIYETIKSYKNNQNIELKIIKTHHPELLSEFKSLNIKLREFKKKYDVEREMSLTRNKTIGHFDKEFLNYYNQIEKMSDMFKEKMVYDFLDFLYSLMEFIQKIGDTKEMQSKRKI